MYLVLNSSHARFNVLWVTQMSDRKLLAMDTLSIFYVAFLFLFDLLECLFF